MGNFFCRFTKICNLTFLSFYNIFNLRKEDELMYKSETENIEIYFICYKKGEMELIETYYDPILDIHSWYFNAYLAYKYWKKEFKKIKMGDMAKNLLTIAASKYIIYSLEKENYRSQKEYLELLKDSKIIEPELKRIIEETSFLDNSS